MIAYYVTLGAVWCIVCLATALMLGDLSPAMRQVPQGLSRWSPRRAFRWLLIHRRIAIPVVGLFLLSCFILSYAPVMSLRITRSRGSLLELYAPVEWLIDNTPSGRPAARVGRLLGSI